MPSISIGKGGGVVNAQHVPRLGAQREAGPEGESRTLPMKLGIRYHATMTKSGRPGCLASFDESQGVGRNPMKSSVTIRAHRGGGQQQQQPDTEQESFW